MLILQLNHALKGLVHFQRYAVLHSLLCTLFPSVTSDSPFPRTFRIDRSSSCLAWGQYFYCVGSLLAQARAGGSSLWETVSMYNLMFTNSCYTTATFRNLFSVFCKEKYMSSLFALTVNADWTRLFVLEHFISVLLKYPGVINP